MSQAGALRRLCIIAPTRAGCLKAIKATPKAFFEAAAVHCRNNALWGETKAQVA